MDTPKTIAEAVAYLAEALSEESRAALIARGPEYFHMTNGMAIRNGLGLWSPESPLVVSAKATYGVDHADDISGLILLGLYGEVSGEPVDLDAEAADYRAHWADLDTKEGPPPGFTLMNDQTPLAFPDRPIHPRG